MKQTVISFSLAIFLFVASSANSQVRQSNFTRQQKADQATLNFSVINKNTWDFIEGLKGEDLSVYEDGDAQQIIQLNSSEHPITMIILLDLSGSMRSFVKLIKEVALETLQTLKPEDEVALITFGNEAELAHDFTKDKKLAGDRIRKIVEADTRGKTFMDKAVFLAAEHLRLSSSPDNHRIIILITDNKMVDVDKSIPPETVRKELRESRAVLCGLIMPEPKEFPEPIFRTSPGKGKAGWYVAETGGLVLRTEEKDARIKLNKAIAGFHKRYALEYRPANKRRDGKSPKIKLQVSKSVEKREGGLIILLPRNE